MPVYMTQFTYTTEAWQALARDPADRRAALRTLLQPLGGRLIELYYAAGPGALPGDADGLVLFEAPDDHAAVAGVVTAMGAGSFKSIKTAKLFTVEEMLQALRTAGQLSYQPVAAR